MPAGLSRIDFGNFQQNVQGAARKDCSMKPLSGYYRNGRCETEIVDHGLHTVFAKMILDLLVYSKWVRTDLSTPRPQFEFAGLKPDDLWCLCASRWQEAFEAGKAPLVKLSSTNIATLNSCKIEDLKKHAIKE